MPHVKRQKIRYSRISFLTVLLVVAGVFVILGMANEAQADSKLQVGTSTLNLAGSDNLYFGNINSSSATTSKLLMLQTGSVPKFIIDYYGNATASGTITAAGFSGSLVGTLGAQNVSSGEFGANSGGGNFYFGSTVASNVGIGTTNPGKKLVVDAGTPGTGVASFTGIGGAAYTEFAVTGTGANKFYIYPHSSGNTYLQHDGNVIFTPVGSTTGQLTVNTSGNVGIGTTNPGAKLVLDLDGTGKTLKFEEWAGAGTYSSYGWGITGSVDKLKLPKTVYFGDSSFYFNISGYNGSLVSYDDLQLSNSHGGQVYLYGDYPSGNVGIGTTNPLYKLDVSGTGSFTQPVIVGTPTASGHATTKSYVDSLLTPGAGTSTVGYWTANGNHIYNANSANVGVGVTNPTQKFQVVDDLSVDSANHRVGIGVTNPIEKLNVVGGNIKVDPSSRQIGYWDPVDTVHSGYIIPYDASGFLQVVSTFGSGGLLFKTGNSANEIMRITAAGNIGIGTTNPLSKLHINSGTLAASGVTDVLTLQMQYATAQEIPRIKISNASNLTYGAIDFPLSPNSSSGAMAFSTNYNGTLGERMRIDGNGNVGIGTTNPLYKLDVSGTGSFTQPVIVGTPTASGHATTKSYVDSLLTPGAGTSTVGYWTANGNHIYNANSANVGIGVTNPVGKLHIFGGASGATSLATAISNNIFHTDYASNSGYGTYFGTINSGGGAYQYIQTANSNNTSAINLALNPYGGNVGIGTTTPAHELDVNGIGRFYGINIGGYQTVKSNLYISTEGASIGFLANSDGSALPIKAGSLAITSNYTNNAPANGLYVQGNVGIGLTNPQYKLDVSGTGQFTQPVIVGTPTASGHATTKSYVDSLLNPGAGTSTVGYWTANGNHIYNANSANVGIGTTNPLQKLVVSGAINASGRMIVEGGSSSVELDADIYGASESGLYSTVGNRIATYNDFDSAYKYADGAIYSDGTNVGLGTTAPSYKLDLTASDVSGVSTRLVGNVNYGSMIRYDRGASYNWQTGIGGTLSNNGVPVSYYGIVEGGSTPRLVISHTTGLVGIGTTAPGYRLDAYTPNTSDAYYRFQRQDTTRPVGLTLGNSTVNRWSMYMPAATDDLRFALGATDYITVKNTDGNVGIGTTNPNFPLDIQSTAASLHIQSTTGTNPALFRAQNTGGEIYLGKDSSAGGQLANSSAAYSGVINSQGSYPLHLAVNNAIAMTIVNGGNVGIGTTTPGSYKLNVNGTSYLGGQITTTLSGSGNRCLYVDASGNVAAKGVDCGTATGGDNLGNHQATQNIQLGSYWLSGDGGNEGVFVKGDGNVGIGLSNPAYRLELASLSGSIEPTSLKVSGSNTAGLQIRIGDGYSASLGTRYSGADTYLAGNAYQGTLASDSWSKAAATYSSAAVFLTLNTVLNTPAFQVKYSPANTATGGRDAFFTSNLLTIFGNGNMGVGTANPQYTLEVSGTGSFTQPVIVGTPTAASHATTKSYVDSLITPGAGTSTVGYWTANGNHIYNANSANVGIGVTNPGEKLEISGNSLISNNNSYKARNLSGTAYSLAGITSGNVVQIGAIDYTTAGTIFAGGDNVTFTTGGAGGTARINITNAGNVGIGIASPTNKLEVAEGLVELSGTTGFTHGVLMDRGPAATTTSFQASIFNEWNGLGNAESLTSRGYSFKWEKYDGTDWMVINSGGNVGIGNTNPQYKLDVSGTGSFTQPVIVGTPTASGHATTKSYVDSLLTPGAGTSTVGYWTANGNHIYNSNSANVGIGTTNPGEKLDVNGYLNTPIDTGGYKANTNVVLAQRNSLGGVGVGLLDYYSRILFDSANSGTIHFQAGNAIAERMTIRGDSGNVGIGTTNPGGKLTISGGEGAYSAPNFGSANLGAINILNTTSDRRNGITFSSAGSSNAQAGIYVHQDNGAGTHMYLATTDSYATGPQARLTILNTGNVGIANTNPLYKLDVSGTGQFTQPVIVGTPTASGHATTKSYVDSLLAPVGGTSTVGYWTANGNHIYNSNSANVGIGISNPAYKFEVADDMRVKGGRLMLTQSSPSDTLMIQNYISGQAQIYTNSTVPLTLGTNNSTTQLYLQSGGNIGIGTTTPAAQLHIFQSAAAANLIVEGYKTENGTMGAGAKLLIKNSYDGDYGSFILRKEADNSSSFLLTTYRASDAYWGEIFSYGIDNKLLRIGTGATGMSSIQPNGGNVGIGNTNPQYKLDVSGTGSFTQPVIVGTPTASGHATTKSYVDSLLTPGAGTSTVGYWTANGNHIYNANSANVGIGITNPQTTLAVKNSATTLGTIVPIISSQLQGSTSVLGSINSVVTNDSLGWGLTFNTWKTSIGPYEALRITDMGNVGIGTTAPIASLQISGSKLGSGTTQSLVINDTWSNSTGGGGREGLSLTANSINSGGGNIDVTRGIVINNPTLTGSHNTLVGLAVAEQTSGVNNTDLLLGSAGAYQSPLGNFALYSASARNSYFAGSVGIGTTNPVSGKLQVSTPTNANTMTLGSNTGVAFSVKKADEGYGLHIGIAGSGTSWIQSGSTAVATAYDLSLQASGGNVLFPGSGIWNSSGSVGIGTTAPIAKLQVSGGNIWLPDAVITSTTTYAVITKSYLDSTIAALSSMATVTTTTPATYAGNVGSYTIANNICANTAASSTHVCTTEEIIHTINIGLSSNIPAGSFLWFNAGPPGYTVNANDCAGWTSNSSNDFGPQWNRPSGDGFGSLNRCNVARKFACCK